MSDSAINRSFKPAHHANNSKSLFLNPWSLPLPNDTDNDADSEVQSLQNSNSFSWFPNLSRFSLNLEWARQHPDHPHKPVKVIKPDFGSDHSNASDIKATWLGHAVRFQFIVFFAEFSYLTFNAELSAGVQQ